jgi:hypothetical protein
VLQAAASTLGGAANIDHAPLLLATLRCVGPNLQSQSSGVFDCARLAISTEFDSSLGGMPANNYGRYLRELKALREAVFANLQPKDIAGRRLEGNTLVTFLESWAGN